MAVGKLYVSGDPSYDEFFSALYQVQLPMGQAADREAGSRSRVCNALGVPGESSAEQIADALDQRAVGLGKSSITLKVKLSGMDAGNAAAELVVSGSPAKPADLALISALGQSLREDAALITDLRSQRPQIDRLKPQADSLEPGIDVTFRKGGNPKKSEVRKNVIDAQRIIPLMSQRSEDTEHLAKEFLQKIQKVLGGPAVAAAPVAPAPAAPESATAPPPKKGVGKTKPAAAHTEPASASAKPKAVDAAPEPKPKPEPKAKPPADDFEP